jgi:hypothetical protein
VRVLGAGNGGVCDSTGDGGRGGDRPGTGSGDAPEPEVSVYLYANILQMVCKTKNLNVLNLVKYHTYEYVQNSFNSQNFFSRSQRFK